MTVRYLTRIALLIAVGLALHAVEAVLPALPVPGARLGLANLATVIALGLLGGKAAITVAVLRSVVGGLIIGTFLSPGFFMSVAGAVVSAVMMSIVFVWGRKSVSLIGVSLIGALSHNLAQLAVAVLIIGYAVVAYLPFLIVFAVPAGLVTGTLAVIMIGRLDCILGRGGR